MDSSTLGPAGRPLASGGIAGWASANPFLAGAFGLLAVGSACAFHPGLRRKDYDWWIGLLGVVSGVVALGSGAGLAMAGWLVLGGLAWLITIGHFHNKDTQTVDDTGGPDGSEDDGEQSLDVASLFERNPDRSFDDIGGMDDLKATLRERVVRPLHNPRQYDDYGLGVVNGVLLHGPPGCGKTYVCGALAGELGYNYVTISPADVVSKYIGQGSRNVARLFELAHRNQPCLVFIDEIDALASDRGSDMTNSEKQMVNQLLTELQEIDGEDIVVVAATNYVDDIDDAILRSGRFDERIEVRPPNAEARAEILRLHLADKPRTADLSLSSIADMTAGYASSDLELVAETAARHALQDEEPIDETHLRAAVAETETSIPDWLHRYDHLDDGGQTTLDEAVESSGFDAADAVLDPSEIVEPDVGRDLDDIAGMTDQRDAIRTRVLDPLSNSELYAESGIDRVESVLLFGPPGCGKETLARATAGTLSVPFLTVGPTTSTVDDAGPAAFFEDVAALARSHGPCVLFIEDVDSFVTGADHPAGAARFVTLLAEMVTSLDADRDVLVFASARSIESVPAELLDEGCFHERIEVPAPDLDTRRALLVEFLDEDVVDDGFGWSEAASQLEGCDVSDVEYVANRLTRQSVRSDEPVGVDAVREVARETGHAGGESSDSVRPI
ncbi:AAA family ATPase [Haloarchaeobius iranensis]|uniref:AAA+-type ATPase, SpoVK/Ycf46/Vps4 family n=1 Tax=Haloarchaeobius iranensis TaxID=996166 RepID=A0A1G9SXX3_9EURY|nr:AAA family ATPase [Haloarchaeobius iranensis]SDM40262.1 AAA+-type ATPase, SpoVK/Ycf46/Vps4 family [Haloarchaeobius iranensis]